ncbi:uncharacterized protein LOC131844948 [Achroia grisella]|uniref:uncharacterized protein LOC131844948 n=1 Tax=Achroia grisella TaxID=688607 RepID=UPI0027D2F741|nr:uncharacterized protein LOC131844948 [Achroia grisella]
MVIISSLENVITEQNNLIKNLISDRKITSKTSVNNGEGNPTSQVYQRPIREARIRASSAIATATKKVTARSNATTTSSGVPPTPCPSLGPNRNREAVITQTENIEATGGNTGEWIEVKRPRTRRSLVNVTRGTGNLTDTTLSAAERKSYLHLYYVKIGTTAEQVIEYLRTICPGDNCFAEALNSRGDYASFKLSVPTKHLDQYLATENWVEDVYIKPWRNGFRQKREQTV